MKILVTAFVPFANNEENFSSVVLNKLKNKSKVIKSFLPVEYIGSVQKIKEIIIKERPDIVLMLGEARSYKLLGFEVIGINEYSERPDNINYTPGKRYIVEGAKDGIFSTIDYELFVSALTETNTKFHRSFSAGTYVCNTLLYSTLKFIEDSGLDIKAGFIHIPNPANQDINEIVLGLENYISKLFVKLQ